jgi:hypothetical protein
MEKITLLKLVLLFDQEFSAAEAKIELIMLPLFRVIER